MSNHTIADKKSSSGNGLYLAGTKFRIFVNKLKILLKQSLLKKLIVAIIPIIIFIGVFFVFVHGFNFAESVFVGFKKIFAIYLFSLLFMALGVLLVISNAIIAYSALFRSKETAFLYSLPIAYESIFLQKLTEITLMSSWAFMFIGTPVILAYGFTEKVAWYFYPLSIIAFFPFVLIPSAFGALLCMVIAKYVPRNKKKLLIFFVILAAIAIVILVGYLVLSIMKSETFLSDSWVRDVLKKLSFATNSFLPSYWLTNCILNLGRGNFANSLFYFLLLSSNALFITMIAQSFARRNLKQGYSLSVSSSFRKRIRKPKALNIVDKLLFFIKKENRLLIQKDIVTFARDPAQYTQVLIFFGLLLVYFLNLRRFPYDISNPFWQNLISFLNLGATCLTLSTFTSRFVYPLMSMEGQKIWILGLAPLNRKSIIKSKFIFSFLGIFLLSVLLISISDYMLEIPLSIILLHLYILANICMGLSAISVGMGARFLNLHEENPSKIVTGFGGTLNLIVSLFFILVIILCTAIPMHYFFGIVQLKFGFGAIFSGQSDSFNVIFGIGLALSLAIGVFTSIICLKIGMKSFESMEF